MNKYSEFIERLEYGHVDCEELCEFLYTNIIPKDDRLFMAERGIDVSMILNGRLNDEQMQGIKPMVQRWNEIVGHRVIFTEEW